MEIVVETVEVNFLITHNVMQLTEGRDFNRKTTMEARNLYIAQNFLRSSKPLLLVRCCYVSVFFFIFCAVGFSLCSQNLR